MWQLLHSIIWYDSRFSILGVMTTADFGLPGKLLKMEFFYKEGYFQWLLWSFPSPESWESVCNLIIYCRRTWGEKSGFSEIAELPRMSVTKKIVLAGLQLFQEACTTVSVSVISLIWHWYSLSCAWPGIPNQDGDPYHLSLIFLPPVDYLLSAPSTQDPLLFPDDYSNPYQSRWDKMFPSPRTHTADQQKGNYTFLPWAARSCYNWILHRTDQVKGTPYCSQHTMGLSQSTQTLVPQPQQSEAGLGSESSSQGPMSLSRHPAKNGCGQPADHTFAWPWVGLFES